MNKRLFFKSLALLVLMLVVNVGGLSAELTAIFSEDFQSMTENETPTGWSIAGSAGASEPSYCWGVHMYSGNNKMIHMANYLTEEGDAQINTPSITLPSTGVSQLTFKYSHRADCGDLIVKLSTNNGSTFTNLRTLTNASGSYDGFDPGTMTDVAIDLASYIGQTVIIRFWANANYGEGGLYVDDVVVLGPAPVTADTLNYLHFVSLKDNGTVMLNKVGSPTAIHLEYSTDKTNWTAYTWSGTAGASIALAKNDTVWFRAGGDTHKNANLSSAVNAKYQFAFGTNDSIAAGGNIMSLYDATCEQKTMTSSGFSGMFSACKALVTAPILPATALKSSCYYSMFADCSSLTAAPALPAQTLAQQCYQSMFYKCTSLTAAPALPAQTLAQQCYQSMFSGCTSLTTAPILPATTLANSCYYGMFYNCSSLTAAPALPAQNLADDCYHHMFQKCTLLTAAPALPAQTLAQQCYLSMFSGCTSLTTAPILPATTLANSCYYRMFYGCTKLYVDTLGASCNGTQMSFPTTTATDWNKEMFTDCTGNSQCTAQYGIQAGKSYCVSEYKEPADTLNYLHFVSLKDNGTVRLDKVGTLYSQLTAELEYSTDKKSWTDYTWTDKTGASITFNQNDTVWFRAKSKNSNFSQSTSSYYNFVFGTNDSIAAGGNIMSLYDASCEQKKMTNYGFYYLFNGCKALVTAPALPAQTLAESCYQMMFTNCTSLTAAPALPATTMAKKCYEQMFYDCTSLTAAPVLPAQTLAERCYQYMFQKCTSLTTAPALPAQTLAGYCYNSMFSGCTSLTTAPALNAQTLASSCYGSMFNGCTSLTTAPALNAQTLAAGCCTSMFSGCTSLYVDTLGASCNGVEMSFPTTTATNWNKDMFKDCHGSYTNVQLGGHYCVSEYIDTLNYLHFVALNDGDTVRLDKMGSKRTELTTVQVEYSKDNRQTWTTYNWTEQAGDTIALAKNDTVWFRAGGTGKNATFSQGSSKYYNFVFGTNDSIAAGGNIMSLYDATCQQDTMTSYGFYQLFKDCKALVTAPALPAQTLAPYCYANMFHGCSSLTTAPALPVTTMEQGCYSSMFRDCSSLTAAPALNATTMAVSCYSSMFRGCTSLTAAPALSAQTLANSCYYNMFLGCTSLRVDTMSASCQGVEMSFPATTTASEWNSNMFKDCHGASTNVQLGGHYCVSEYKEPAGTGIFTVTFTGTCVPTSNEKVFIAGNFYDTPSWERVYEMDKTGAATWTYMDLAYPADFKFQFVIQYLNKQGEVSEEVWNPTDSIVFDNVTYDYELEAGCPSPKVSDNYLHFVSLKDNGTVRLDKMGAPDTINLEYSKDKQNWTAYTWTDTVGASVALAKNDTVWFRAGGAGKNATCSKDGANYYNFVFGTNDSIAAAGNTMSLYDATCAKDTMTTNGFYKLFYGCTALVSAPELPATKLAARCYFSMFSGCTSLTVAPELNAQTLADFCYVSMFNGCSSLYVDTLGASCDGVEMSFPETTAQTWSMSMFKDCHGNSQCTAPYGILPGKSYCVSKYIPRQVTGSVNDTTMGSVTGAGEYQDGTEVTLTATPNANYSFVNWSNGETTNPYSLTVTSDTTLTANFVANIITGITTAPYKGMYDAQSHNVAVSGTIAGDSVTYSTDSVSWSASFSQTNAVAQKVFVKVARENYFDYVTTDSVIITKRAVTLTSATDSKSYDGTPLTNSNVSVSGDGFVDGEGATYDVTGTQTAAGNSQNEFTYTLTGTTAKPENYKVDTVYGTLTVTPASLSSASIEPVLNQTYTGDSIKPDINIHYDAMTLVKDSDYTVVYSNNVNVGQATATITGKGNYTDSESMNFTIDPATITDVTTAPYKGMYDGTAHNITVSGTLAGDTVSYSPDSVTWVNLITCHNVCAAKVFVKVARQNYYDYVTSDSVIITKRSVTLTSANDTKSYDGTPLTNDTVYVTSDGFVEGEGATYNVTGSQNKVGDSQNEFTYTLTGATEEGNYAIDKVEGTLTVTQNMTLITITASDSTKMYDGTALTRNTYTYTGDLAQGNAFSFVTVSGTITDFGEVANTIDTFMIADYNGENVTFCYGNIQPVNGKLSITKRSITLTSPDSVKYYDTKPLINHNVEETGDGFVEGEGYTLNVTGTQTKVGESDNTFTYTLKSETKAVNYDIVTNLGTLTVLSSVDPKIVGMYDKWNIVLDLNYLNDTLKKLSVDATLAAENVHWYIKVGEQDKIDYTTGKPQGDDVAATPATGFYHTEAKLMDGEYYAIVYIPEAEVIGQTYFGSNVVFMDAQNAPANIKAQYGQSDTKTKERGMGRDVLGRPVSEGYRGLIIYENGEKEMQ